jgi:hypothetical protein
MLVVFFAILHVAMTQSTLPTSIMTDNESDESFFSLFASDSGISAYLMDEGESTLENLFFDLDEEEGNMNDNPSHPAMPTGGKKGKEESSSEEDSEESTHEKPTPKKRKKEDDSSHVNDSDVSKEETSDEEESDIDENAFDEDMLEKELELPPNRNRKENGKAIEPNHHRRNLPRNMAAQGLCENRDVTQLTSTVATSPRLKAILDANLSKWKPSLMLLVRSTRPPHQLRSCRLLS